MSQLSRFGVSMGEDLLKRFDEYIVRRQYTNRSDAVRDLVRTQLADEEWMEGDSEVTGTVTLVYDHHGNQIKDQLTDLQHDYHGQIISCLHVHLDHHNCLEVIILRGAAATLRVLADRLTNMKGIKIGRFTVAATGHDLP